MKNTSYWLDTAPAPPALTPEPLPDRCGVAVIGGGFTGLMVALERARDGQAVRVFDQGRMAGGASSRNAGQTLAGSIESAQWRSRPTVTRRNTCRGSGVA
jgi:gamma-glutamylputrescine oxidase